MLDNSIEFLNDNPNIEKLFTQLADTYSYEFTDFLNNSISLRKLNILRD